MNNRKQLKTGGDPRALPDYEALRDVLARLSHPARPDVDWERVAQLSLSLFRQNGVELQTLSWYTLARTRLAGLLGLNEGLAILEALLTHQWGTLWPQPVHARMEILAGFSQRLQSVLRTFTLHSADLPQIYRAEQHLNAVRDILQRLALKNASQMGDLCIFMHMAATRLENRYADNSPDPAVMLPATFHLSPDLPPAATFEPLVYIACEAPAAPRVVTELPKPKRGWKSFTGGMLTMLALCAASSWGWRSLIPTASGPLPVAANEAALTALGQLSPLWLQNYGFILAAGARPDESEKLTAQWRRHIVGSALPSEALCGWHQGMEGLHELTRRLNALDERKGRYLTGSELKSMVFAITQNFGRTIPVEERLYQLNQVGSGTPLPAELVSQIDRHLHQLLSRYTLITQQAEGK
ncbi:VasL domain-containing protein [Martelella alba]|uniref:Type VI secretion system protein VasL n=1 Tax=Martelella alba TaxID=2590451 RepID=A0ABY2SFZ6_9HYPH|nr:VasL domain-containing protein [Martelella alba]TKI03720.1 hypothetical protein FCN80_20585 [Martelella alba]